VTPDLLHYATYAPQRVISGVGAVEELAAQLEKLGKKRAFILTGNSLAKKTDLVAKVEALSKPRTVA
jgi:alcohol dehydrogenase class IV